MQQGIQLQVWTVHRSIVHRGSSGKTQLQWTGIQQQAWSMQAQQQLPVPYNKLQLKMKLKTNWLQIISKTNNKLDCNSQYADQRHNATATRRKQKWRQVKQWSSFKMNNCRQEYALEWSSASIGECVNISRT